MNRTFTLIIIMIGVVSMSEQSLEREVIESAGITLSNEAVAAITDGTNILSQGFYQRSLLTIKINPFTLLKLNNEEESLIRDDLHVVDYIPTTSLYANTSTVQNSILRTIDSNVIVDLIMSSNYQRK